MPDGTLYQSAQEAPTLELDTDAAFLIPSEALDTPDKVDLHNAKVEIAETLWSEQNLDSNVVYALKGDTLEDLDADLVEEYLESMGDMRTVSEIVEEHYDDELTFEDAEVFEPTTDLFEWAKAAKGTTDDLYEAGYVLPDGELLDFSGKREGGPAGGRAEDHRQLGQFFGST